MNGALQEGCAALGHEAFLVAGIRNSLRLIYTQRRIQDLGWPSRSKGRRVVRTQNREMGSGQS